MSSPVPDDEEAPLVAVALPPQRPKNYTRDVHTLSLAFLLIFLSYGAAQNLQSTLNTVSLCEFFFLNHHLLQWFASGDTLSSNRMLQIWFYFGGFLRFCWVDFILGAKFGYDFTWDIVFVLHIFLFSFFFDGTGARVKECSGYWDNWLLGFRSCKLKAKLVITRYVLFILSNVSLWRVSQNVKIFIVGLLQNLRKIFLIAIYTNFEVI